MRSSIRWLLLLMILALLALPRPAFAQGDEGDKFVFGGSYTLADGEEIGGNLYIFGGNAELEEGSTVNGNVVLMGGNLEANGSIQGDVLGFGGLITLGETAVVEGDVSVTEGNLQRDAGAVIEGSVNRDPGANIPGQVQDGRPGLNVDFSPLLDGMWFMFQSFLWAALAVLVVMFLPNHIQRVSQTVFSQPLISGGLGLLTVVVLPLAMVIMAITLILLPVSLLTALVLVILWAFGMIAIGTEIGHRLAEQLHQEWAMPVQAAVGTFGTVVVVNGFAELVPCVGWIVPTLVGAAGLGAVIMTRLGTIHYPPVDPLAGASGWTPPTPAPAPAAPGWVPGVPVIPPASPAPEEPLAADPPASEPPVWEPPAEPPSGQAPEENASGGAQVYPPL